MAAMAAIAAIACAVQTAELSEVAELWTGDQILLQRAAAAGDSFVGLDLQS